MIPASYPSLRQRDNLTRAEISEGAPLPPRVVLQCHTRTVRRISTCTCVCVLKKRNRLGCETDGLYRIRATPSMKQNIHKQDEISPGKQFCPIRTCAQSRRNEVLVVVGVPCLPILVSVAVLMGCPLPTMNGWMDYCRGLSCCAGLSWSNFGTSVGTTLQSFLPVPTTVGTIPTHSSFDVPLECLDEGRLAAPRRTMHQQTNAKTINTQCPPHIWTSSCTNPIYSFRPFIFVGPS